MCLEELSSFKVKLGKNRVGRGWKLFFTDRNSGEFIGDFKSVNVVRPKNKWLKEGDFRPAEWKYAKKIKIGPSFHHRSYALGFHVFLTREGAIMWANGSSIRIKQIKFRKPVATGLQMGYQCVVAKEIFIPKEA